MRYPFIIWILLYLNPLPAFTQCAAPISGFPYQESFELTNGGWVTGGNASSWAWGVPAKSVISVAGDGQRCWMAGGLNPGTNYNDGEASFLQSPCFDFSNLTYPWLQFKVFWETEYQWDGASLQYSVDNGLSWRTAGGVNDRTDCLNRNWFNTAAIGTLGTMGTNTQGWTGNGQANSGSCRGGNGSRGWVLAGKTLPMLAGETSVIFRFVFGAGTTCNNYDGFAIDSVWIGEAPPNQASFRYECDTNRTIRFFNTSPLCPQNFRWEFDDPLSPFGNTSTLENPVHQYLRPGSYTVTFTIDGPGNAPSTTTRDIIIADAEVTQINPASCETNAGGSLGVSVTGAGNTALSYTWNTNPPQQGPLASGLAAGNYNVSITGSGICAAAASGTVSLDDNCRDLLFPSGFTPNGDGRNDFFGPLGSAAAVTAYRLRIYNRWGEQVFYSTNPAEKWNGRIRGIYPDTGIYAWYCEYRLPGKSLQSKKGTLTLIR